MNWYVTYYIFLLSHFFKDFKHLTDPPIAHDLRNIQVLCSTFIEQNYALVLFFRRCCCYIYAYDQKTVYVSQNFIIYSSESLSMLYACVCLYDVICVCQRSFSIFQGHDFYFMKPKIEVNELMMITRTIPT